MYEKYINARFFVTKNLYFRLMLGFVVVGLPLALLLPKTYISLLVNNKATIWADSFFVPYTDLGLGWTVAIFAFLFLFIRFYYSLWALVSLMFCGIFTYYMKQVLFHGMLRPVAYIGLEHLPHVIPDYEYVNYNTFPSGHTMTAFTLAVVLASLNRKNWLAILAFAYAISIAFSRIYLMVHFFVDTYVGGILGVIAALIGLVITNFVCRNANWQHYSLLNVFSKKKRAKIIAKISSSDGNNQ